jgi:hypothetical protein
MLKDSWFSVTVNCLKTNNSTAPYFPVPTEIVIFIMIGVTKMKIKINLIYLLTFLNIRMLGNDFVAIAEQRAKNLMLMRAEAKKIDSLLFDNLSVDADNHCLYPLLRKWDIWY